MQKNKQGFTLIELLVVVLIIGILAAVAVPKYQKNVRKIKAAQAMNILQKIVEHQELYYLANQTYTENITDLDIGLDLELLDKTDQGKYADKYTYYCVGSSCRAEIRNALLPHFEFWMKHQATSYGHMAGKRLCVTRLVNDRWEICKALGTSATANNYWVYMN